jgi:hypothetical protein
VRGVTSELRSALAGKESTFPHWHFCDLERVLLPLNRSVEILPDVHAALYRPRQHDVKKFCTDPACLTLSRDPQLERNRTSTQWRGGHEQPGSDPACRPG